MRLKKHPVVKSVRKTYKKAKKHVDDGYLNFYELRKTFLKFLRQEGFVRMDSGGFKTVYKHSKHKELLVKVYHEDNGHEHDSDISTLPKCIKKHVLKPVVQNELYIIQERADGNRGKWKSYPKRALYTILKTDYRKSLAEERDVLGTNVKFHQGNPVVIDFC